MTLHAINDSEFEASQGEHRPIRLPAFEGQPVEFARVKLSGVTGLDVGDHVNRIDDVVKLVVEGRVVRVDHVVDDKSGRLIRVHTIKAVDVVQLNWNTDAGEFSG